MDHLPKLGRRQRWLRAGRKHAVMSMWRALVALGLCAFILGLSVGTAFAQTVCYAYRAENFVNGNFPTAMAACQAMMAQYNADSGNTATVTSTAGNNCRVTLVYSNGNATEYDKSFGTFTQLTVDCPPPPVDCSGKRGQAATATGRMEWRGLTASPSFNLYPGCLVKCERDKSWDMGASGWFSSGSCSYTGDAYEGPVATPSGPPVPSNEDPVPDYPAPERCAIGYPGTVGGNFVCAQTPPGEVASGNDSTKETVAADGSKTVETVSRETRCTGQSCNTITTTTTNTFNSAGAPTGSSVKVETEGKPRDSFCAENPGIAICKSSAFGGACGGGFQCDGDAVQCAIAREQHNRNCALYVTETPQSAAGYAALSAGDRPGDHPANDPTAEALDFGTRIDQTDRLGGGSLADLVVPVGTLTAVTIPFSQLQMPLAMLGNLLVGVSMLWALFIVFGRAK